MSVVILFGIVVVLVALYEWKWCVSFVHGLHFIYNKSDGTLIYDNKNQEIMDAHMFLVPVKNMVGKRSVSECKKLENAGDIIGTFPPSVMKLFRGSMASEFGERHKQLRSAFTPFLTPSKIPTFYTAIDKYTKKYILDKLTREYHDVQLQKMIRFVTFSVICESLLGEPIAEDYTEWMDDFHTLTNGIISLPVMIWGTSFFRAEMARQRLQRRVELYLEKSQCDTPFLQEARKHYTDKDSLAKCVLGFIFAGFDTTASLLSSTLCMLTLYPEYINRCKDDPEMIKLCIKETIRLHPPALVATRKAVRDTHILGRFIPQGTTLTWITHDNGYLEKVAVGEDSKQFWPERFLINTKDYEHAISIPFGFGSRRCLGMTFSLKEAEHIVQILIENCEWRATRKLEIYRCPITHEKNYLPVQIRTI